MGWLDPLHGQLVGLDTAPVIYYMERHPQYFATVQPFFHTLDQGLLLGVTSIVTLTEVLVHPFRLGNDQLAQRYRHILLHAPHLTTFSITPTIAEEAARARASYNLRTPDALQLATVRSAGARFFLTNDSRFAKIPGLTVLDVDTLVATGAQP